MRQTDTHAASKGGCRYRASCDARRAEAVNCVTVDGKVGYPCGVLTAMALDLTRCHSGRAGLRDRATYRGTLSEGKDSGRSFRARFAAPGPMTDAHRCDQSQRLAQSVRCGGTDAPYGPLAPPNLNTRTS